jgi:nucleoside-diphosphate-sugar epimerase
VLSQSGADILDLIGWWLGPLVVESLVDDSLGGVEAEAVLRLRAGAASGVVELSRLRRLRNSVVLTGGRGRVEFDLDALTARAEPASLLAPDPPAPEQGLSSGDTARTIAEAYARRRRRAHVWEDAAEAAPGPLSGRQVLVTGGLGFIGARLVEKLTAQGAEVTVATRDLRRAARTARLPVRLLRTGLASAAEADAAVAGQELVFNLAYDFRRSGAANFQAYRRLADACARGGVSRFVQASSIAVYDGWPREHLREDSPKDAPGHPYKLTKRRIERDLAERAGAGQFAAAIVQPTVVYGPFSALWTDALVAHFQAGTVELPADAGLCNGVYVDDVVDAMIAAAAAPALPATGLIVSGPRPFPWRRLLEGYAEAAGGELVLAPPMAATAPSAKARALKALRAVASGPLGILLDWARESVGEDRIARLRERVLAAKGGAGPSIHRPAMADPALFGSTAACSIEAASRLLGPPTVEVEEGLRRTRAYIRWRWRGAPFDEAAP